MLMKNKKMSRTWMNLSMRAKSSLTEVILSLQSNFYRNNYCSDTNITSTMARITSGRSSAKNDSFSSSPKSNGLKSPGTTSSASRRCMSTLSTTTNSCVTSRRSYRKAVCQIEPTTSTYSILCIPSTLVPWCNTRRNNDLESSPPRPTME